MARTLTAIDNQLRATTHRLGATREKLRDLDTVLRGMNLRRTRYLTEIAALQRQADHLLDQRAQAADG